MVNVSEHYDLLIENNNDPINDSEELKRYMDKWDGEIFINELKLDKQKNCLEIGCGTGRVLQKILGNFKNYLGVDVSARTICRAKEHFKDNNIGFICADFLDLDFSQSFDLVFSTLTFMHIKYKKKAIIKIYALLNIGGKVVLSIDKNQNTILDTGYSKVKIYPDDKNYIEQIFVEVGFNNIKCIETEFAYIFSANKK